MELNNTPLTNHPCPMLLRQFLRSVFTKAVHHDYVVTHSFQRFQTPNYMLLLILREDDSSNRIIHFNYIFLGFQQLYQYLHLNNNKLIHRSKGRHKGDIQCPQCSQVITSYPANRFDVYIFPSKNQREKVRQTFKHIRHSKNHQIHYRYVQWKYSIQGIREHSILH